MHNIINKIIHKLSKISFSLRAKIFSLFFLKNKIGNLVSEDFVHKSILIVAPHADDEFIGCYELIKAKSPQTKIKIFLCSYLGNNTSENNKIIRTNEFVNSCTHLKVDYVIADNTRLKDDLRNCIEDFEPDYIFLTSVIDPHYEHRKINYLLSDILKQNVRKCKIIWYPVSMPISSEYVNMIQEFNSEEKWKLFNKIYKSQSKMHLARFQAEEKMLGRLFNTNTVESFILLTNENWVKALENLSDDMVRTLDKIKNDGCESYLFRIYRLSRKYYQRILRNSQNNIIAENALLIRQLNLKTMDCHATFRGSQ